MTHKVLGEVVNPKMFLIIDVHFQNSLGTNDHNYGVICLLLLPYQVMLQLDFECCIFVLQNSV